MFGKRKSRRKRKRGGNRQRDSIVETAKTGTTAAVSCAAVGCAVGMARGSFN